MMQQGIAPQDPIKEPRLFTVRMECQFGYEDSEHGAAREAYSFHRTSCAFQPRFHRRGVSGHRMVEGLHALVPVR